MSQITLKGNPVNTTGTLPEKGAAAPDFTMTKTDLSDVSLSDFKGSKLVLNIFPSIDTDICAMSVRKFNSEAASLDNTEILCVSLDLPFAHKRFCGAEGIEKVHAVSELRDRSFGDDYGVRMVDGPLKGLFSRAVVVIDEQGTVKYTQQVPEIGQEPDYEKALEAVKSI